jgi:calmodulin
MSAEQVGMFRDMFKMFDVDTNDRITTAELATVMRSMGMETTDDEAKDLVREVDVDGSGAIDFQEFLVLMGKATTDTDVEADLNECFKAFDVDNVGYLTHDTLKKSISQFSGQPLKDEDVDAILVEAGYDLQSDVRIDFSEFVDMLCDASKPADWAKRSSRVTGRSFHD